MTADDPDPYRLAGTAVSTDDPSYGAFVSGVLAALTSAALLVWVAIGFTFNDRWVLYVYLPVMIVSFTLSGVAMGWMFVSIGRTKRWPRWPEATAALIAVTLLELFALTYVTSLHSPPPGG